MKKGLILALALVLAGPAGALKLCAFRNSQSVTWNPDTNEFSSGIGCTAQASWDNTSASRVNGSTSVACTGRHMRGRATCTGNSNNIYWCSCALTYPFAGYGLVLSGVFSDSNCSGQCALACAFQTTVYQFQIALSTPVA